MERLPWTKMTDKKNDNSQYRRSINKDVDDKEENILNESSHHLAHCEYNILLYLQ